jgi:hypothetical protein
MLRGQADAQATDEGQRSDCEERDLGRVPGFLWISDHTGKRDS